QAVELARKAVQLSPQTAGCWTTLGLAHYRAGDGKAAIAALEKSVELDRGQGFIAHLFLAMAHQQLGNRDQARKAYDLALQSLDKYKTVLERDECLANELRRVRSEAEQVLELKKK